MSAQRDQLENLARSNTVDEGGAANKTAILAEMLSAQYEENPVAKILVVGCGTGFDAGVLARYFRCSTIGIDLRHDFDRRASAPAELVTMDACDLKFADGSFDLIYSFHALEHIPDYRRALSEMSRVLRSRGIYCIGTPNSGRIVGYVGTNIPLATKLRWNLDDWRARLAGRFHNEDGAHAGFKAAELERLCFSAFGDAHSVSDEYYMRLYRRHSTVLRRLIQMRLQRFAWPSVYIFGSKTQS
jgi:ubiquinone/menaquinone biosynthesis C-methylase UbiE